MSRKQKKVKKQPQQQAGHANQGKGVNWDLVWKVLASIFAFAGSMVAVYELVNYFRSDARTFYSLIFPGFAIIIWLIILVQLVRKKNPYVILLLAITVLGGVVGGIGWQSYNQTQEDKIIVLVAEFDGPEETYGLRMQMMEDLREATKNYDDIVLIEGEESVTSSEIARNLGENEKADLVIWAWYRPTENPNITIHIENLSPTELDTLQKSETYQPTATLGNLESFEIQKQIGAETSNLVNFLAGYLQLQIGDPKTALKRFDVVLQSDENIPVINQIYLFLLSGFSHFLLGNYDDAIKNFDQVIQIDPNFAIAYNGRAVFYQELGQYERAIQDVNRAIQIDPSYATAYNTRGYSYIQLGQIERAIQDLDKAIVLNPNFAVAYNTRGYSYNQIGQYERAIKDLDRAIELDSNFVKAYGNRADSYNYLGQYKYAIHDLDEALRLDPNYVILYGNRGYSYIQIGQCDHAIKDLDHAIQLDPNFVDAYGNRGLCYFQFGQYEQAVENFSRAIELNPANPLTYTNRGNAFYVLKKYDAAIQDYDKAIGLDQTYSDAWLGRGLAYRELGKIAEAEADFKKYEELTGEKP